MQQHSSNICTAVFGCGALKALSGRRRCPKRRALMQNLEIARPQDEEHRIDQGEQEESNIHTTNNIPVHSSEKCPGGVARIVEPCYNEWSWSKKNLNSLFCRRFRNRQTNTEHDNEQTWRSIHPLDEMTKQKYVVPL
jgi:hypothetical protein